MRLAPLLLMLVDLAAQVPWTLHTGDYLGDAEPSVRGHYLGSVMQYPPSTNHSPHSKMLLSTQITDMDPVDAAVWENRFLLGRAKPRWPAC